MDETISDPAKTTPITTTKDEIAQVITEQQDKSGIELNSSEQIPGLLQRLRQTMGMLSPIENQIAEFILKQPQHVMRLPIDQLAREIGVSLGSLSKFCHMLGYSGFKEFKLVLAAELKSPFQLDNSLISNGDNLEEIAKKTVSANVDALLSILKNLDKPVIEKTIEVIQVAQRIDLYGFGISGVVALDAYNRFFSLGLKTNCLTDLSHQMISANLLKTGDVAMAISYSGESTITANALKLARQNGATTIAITGNRHSPVAQQSDLKLLVFPREPTPFISNLHVAARTAMIGLIDIIYLGLLHSSEKGPEKLGQISASVGSLTTQQK